MRERERERLHCETNIGLLTLGNGLVVKAKQVRDATH